MADVIQLLGQGFINPNITYTNSTGKTYFDQNGVLQTAAANVWPDEYDPVTLAYKGKSVWQGSTNQCLYSNTFTSTGWILSNVSTTQNEIGPDGVSNSAWTLQVTNVSNPSLLNNGYALPNPITAPFTFSMWVKAGTISQVLIDPWNDTAEVGYNATYSIIYGPGSVSAGQGSGQGTISGLSTTQWTKIQATIAQATLTAGDYISIYIKPQGPTINVGDNLIIYGVQHEYLGFPTPFIPTTSSTVTRSADVATIPASVFGSQAVYTFIAAGQSGPNESSSDPNANYETILGSDSFPGMRPLYFEGTPYPAPLASELNATTLATANNQAALASFIAGISTDGTNQYLCLSGGAVSNQANTESLSGRTLYIGGASATNHELNGWISSLVYYPYAMTAEQLQNAASGIPQGWVWSL